jgi:hypothetical protein
VQHHQAVVELAIWILTRRLDMKTRVILAVAAVAFVTGGTILALARPTTVEAIDNKGPKIESPVPKATKPSHLRTELEVADCRFVLSADKAEYLPKEMPVLTLQATNITGKPIEASVALQMLSMITPSPMARVLPTPTPVWNRDCLVKLEPGQTKRLELEPEALLVAGPQGAQLTITMTAGDKMVQLQSLTVAGTAPLQDDNLPLVAIQSQPQFTAPVSE